MKIREIKESELDYLWNFEKENRRYKGKILGRKFWLFYRHKINEKEKIVWLRNVKKAFKNKNTKIFIVEDDKQILGYIWIKTYLFDYSKPKERAGQINEFFLTKKIRGKGISTKLMNKSLKWFKKQKVKFVYLSVIARNERVIEIYKKFGFEPCSLDMKKKI